MTENINPNASALSRFGSEYYYGAQDSLCDRANTEGNKDGKYTYEEFAESFFSKTESPYYQSSSFKDQADALVNKNTDLFKFYAGDDGVLNTNEYCNLINSDEYDEFITSWRDLNDKHNGSGSFLQGVDHHYSNNQDGKVTPEEYFTYQLDLYKNIFDGDSEKIERATQLAIADYFIMKDFAGEDNEISIDDSDKHLNSDSYGKILDEYWSMRDDYDAKHSDINNVNTNHIANKKTKISSRPSHSTVSTETNTSSYNDFIKRLMELFGLN